MCLLNNKKQNKNTFVVITFNRKYRHINQDWNLKDCNIKNLK